MTILKATCLNTLCASRADAEITLTEIAPGVLLIPQRLVCKGCGHEVWTEQTAH